jgi:RimJ/RimL family protein N-acetyltransferase
MHTNLQPLDSSQPEVIKSPEILIDVPEVLETQRLILRCPLPTDGPGYYDFVSECAADLKQWFGPWAKKPFSLLQCEELVRKLRCEFMQRSELNYFWFLKDTNKIIGGAFLLKLNWSVPKGMLAYYIRPSEQRKGFGYEAVEAIKHLAFNSLHFERLEIYVHPDNAASQKLAAKSGFELEGRFRNYRYDNFGVLHDFLCYSIILPDIDSSATTNAKKENSLNP